MNFAAPLWAWLALPLVASVLLLHVRKRRERVVPSLEIWRRAGATSGVRARVTWAPPVPSANLFLQLGAVLAVTFAFMQPYVGPTLPDHMVLVVEAGRTAHLLAGASSQATIDDGVASLVATLPRSTRVSLVSVGAEVRTVFDRLPGRADVAGRFAVELDDGAPNWVALATRIGSWVDPAERTEVRIWSSGPSEPKAREAFSQVASSDSAPVSVVWEPLAAATSSAAIVDVRLSDGDGRVGTTLDVDLVDLGASDAPVRVAVDVEPWGAPGLLAWAEVEARRGRAGAITASIPLEGLPEAGAWIVPRVVGDATLPPASSGDRLAVVDEGPWRLWSSATPRSPRVLYVGDLDALADGSVPPLMRALQALDVELEVANDVPTGTATYDLVVVDGVAVERAPATSAAWFGVAPPDGRTPVTFPPLVTSPGDDPDHPLATSLDPLAWKVDEVMAQARLPGSRVLVWADDVPVVQARTTEVGREVVVGFDPERSSWPTRLDFPAFVADLVAWSTFPDGRVLDCVVARPCALPRAALAVPFTVTDPRGVVSGPREATTLPGGDRVWLEGAFEAAFVPTIEGRYSVTIGAVEVPVAVRATTVDTGTATEFAAALERSSRDETAASTTRPGVGRSVAGWIWIVAALLAVADVLVGGLVAEGFLRRSSVNPAGRWIARHLVTQGFVAVAAAAALLGVWDVRAPHVDEVVERVVVAVDGRPMDEVVDAIGRAVAPVRATGGDDLPTVLLEVDGPAALDRDGWLDVLSGIPTVAGVAGVRSDVPFDVVVDAPATVAAPVRLVGPWAPAGIRVGQDGTLRAEIVTGRDGPVTVRWWRGDVVDATTTVDVTLGRAEVRHDTTFGREGPDVWTLEVVDDAGQQTSAQVVVDVGPAIHVLVVSRDQGWATVFADLLAAQGITSETSVPVDMPWAADDWAPFDVAVLLDVPAIDVHSVQQDLLASWIADRGGGALLAGGPNAFGPGGYLRTVLDDISPLSSEVPRDAPEVAMAFVLDRSGSMQQTVGEGTRLDVAKAATVSALDLLGERSYAGVVVFDEVATTLVPMLPLAQRGEIEAALDRLGAAGGTSIHPALLEVLGTITAVDSATRHVVLFTDGLSQPGDFEGALDAFQRFDVSLSTVGVGQGTDANQLSQLARWGGGSFHQTNDFRALPSILAQEALLLSGSPVVEGRVPATWVDLGVPFEDLTAASPEDVLGHVATTVRPEATLHLEIDAETPLLASWPYGLGRVAAFASEAAGPWASAWGSWSDGPRVWAETIRFLAPRTVEGGASVRTGRDGMRAWAEVTVVDDDGVPVEGLMPVLDVTPRVGTEDGTDEDSAERMSAVSVQVVLEAVAPGRYGATWTWPPDAGASIVVRGTPPGRSDGPVTATLVVTSRAGTPEAARDEGVEAWWASAERVGGTLDVRSGPGASPGAEGALGLAAVRETRLEFGWRRGAWVWWTIAALAWAVAVVHRYLPPDYGRWSRALRRPSVGVQ